MDVILLEKMGKIGDVGDQITVKAGYARNFLFPYSKAIPATKQNVVEFESRREELLKNASEKMQGEEKRAAQLAGISLTIEANASEEGKLYGSVGTREITDAAAANGHEIDKSEVELPDGPLHEVGEFDVTLILSPEVSTEIKVTIVASGAGPDAVIEPEESAEEEAPAESEGATDEPPAE
jgi:large subunit ribosomal protein L9